jgi:Fic family protein
MAEISTHWKKEVATVGAKVALLNRLEFHGGFTLNYAVQMTGLAQSTVKKHLRKLVEEGQADASPLDGDTYFKNQPRPRN